MKILNPRLLKELKKKRAVLNIINQNDQSQYAEIYTEFNTMVDTYENSINEYNAIVEKSAILRNKIQTQTNNLRALKERAKSAIILELGKKSPQYKDYNHSSEYTIQKARTQKAKNNPQP